MQVHGVDDVISFNAGIKASEGVQWQQVSALLDEMQFRHSLSVVTLNSGISACERSDQWQQAVQLFRELSLWRLTPTLKTFGAAISACETGGRWQEAVALLHELHEQRLRSSAIAFNAAISACGKSQQWQVALSLFNALQSIGFPTVSINTAITAFAKAGRWREALHLLRRSPLDALQTIVIRYSSTIGSCEFLG